MPWKSLVDRLPDLPLVLAGPILRRVEKNSVSVWLALKEERDLTLSVYDTAQPNQALLVASASTTKLGQHLHVVVLTAKVPPSQGPLLAHQIYGYNVTLTGTTTNLLSAAQLAGFSYTDQGYQQPTFSLPPTAIGDLRIVHGSCRKLQAEGFDAFPVLDDMIRDATRGAGTNWAKTRPHQLFLTGDQIYADDVAGLLLFLIQDAQAALLGWEETLTLPSGQLRPTDAVVAVGQRAALINARSGFKFERGDEEIPQNHLIFLGEYYCMYLLMWSDRLWPDAGAYPTFEQVYPASRALKPKPKKFAEEVEQAHQFQAGLGSVQRALANVPTYMICDDHEITDDWFITSRWTDDVLGSKLGTRILQNGVLAYALFQAWGNTPEQFSPATTGYELLQLVPEWGHYDAPVPGTTTSRYERMYGLLGLPDQVQTRANHRLMPAANLHLVYYYHIDWGAHEVIVLDTRLHRRFPNDNADGHPELIDKDSLEAQIPAFSTTAELTFLVIATPVSGVTSIERKLQNAERFKGVYYTDAEPYSGQPKAVENLYAMLAYRAAEQRDRTGRTGPARLVALSGDVHYAFSNRVEYWAGRTCRDTLQTRAPEAHFVLAQLCASALKNEKGVIHDNERLGGAPILLPRTGTNAGHMNGYSPRELTRGTLVAGWMNDTAGLEVGHWGGYPGQKLLLDSIGCETISLSDRAKPGDAEWPLMRVQPDWRYRIDYLVSQAGTVRPYTYPPTAVQDPDQLPADQALQQYFYAARNYKKYETSIRGRQIVGKNNIGEVRFQSWGATEASKVLVHQLWWRMLSALDRQTELPDYPLSSFLVLMGENSQQYPRLTFIQY